MAVVRRSDPSFELSTLLAGVRPANLHGKSHWPGARPQAW